MITGAHVTIYSTDATADRALLRDVLQLSCVDAGGGWLIFKLPPAEVAVHPAEASDRHELFLTCDDVEAAVRDLTARGVACDSFTTPAWGKLTRVHLPGGGSLGLYQPRHAQP